MAAARSSASSGWRQKSQARPERAALPAPSQAAQLLRGSPSPLKPPSTWYPEVATPTAKPSPRRLAVLGVVGGQGGVAAGIRSSLAGGRGRRGPPASPARALSGAGPPSAWRRQRGRHDVDLVASLADQRPHLRPGGVAPSLQRGRLHVAGRADDLGHLASHRLGATRPAPAGSRRSSRSRSSSSPATVRNERQTAGSSATGASWDPAWATATSASSTATHMRRRTREAAPRLRSPGVARPACRSRPAASSERVARTPRMMTCPRTSRQCRRT